MKYLLEKMLQLLLNGLQRKISNASARSGYRAAYNQNL